ncbi:MAG: response regulator transcription factor [Spirochaetales bacterium]|jgi:two-component system, OmpR family, alkaline phosphatase synthesis response regulator PhoP|nr:response regulator transcription factor [Spirochaetales bacterium]
MSRSDGANTVLLVEDEESLAIGLEYNLSEEGYHVLRAEDGLKAVELFDANDIDLVVLDIMLPYMDGFQVAEHIRDVSPQVPILMLTARASADDRIHGLEIGADDYLAKPFHLAELLLRVRGMLKRKEWYRNNIKLETEYTFSEIRIDFSLLKAQVGEKEFRITPLEGMLLKYLSENPLRIISRKELLENVWQSTSEIETRTVDNFILRLRKYFEPETGGPIYFRSVRGAGYLFSPDGIAP